jgi:ABC-2 type transport system ATP-binding protein
MTGLIVDNVGVRYGRDRWAVRGVSLRLEQGVLGIVGPNGAGKTTLLRLLASVLKPSEGNVTWDGADVGRNPWTLRQVLGYVPQDFGVYPQLTAREFLRYIGALKGLQGALLRRRVDAALETVHLPAEADRPLREFSGGMVRRVGIAQALLAEPKLLVLDEPTSGVDPAERVSFRNVIAAVQRERLVVLATHIIADVEATATELALLQRGRVTWAGTPAGLLADTAGSVWSLTVRPDQYDLLRQTCRLSAAHRRGEMVELRVLAETQPCARARPAPPTLEDAHLSFIGVD